MLARSAQRHRCVGAGTGGRWVTLGQSSWRGRRWGSRVRFCGCGRTRRDPTVLRGIAPHGERLDLARLVVRHCAVRGHRQRRAGGRNARNRRRAAVLVQRRKYLERRAGLGIDVDPRFVARYELFTAVARWDAARGLGGVTIRLGRHHLGRAVVGCDDRRLAAARRANIGSIGYGPHHGQRQRRCNGHHPTPASARLRLFFVAALMGVRIVQITSIFLLDGFDQAIPLVRGLWLVMVLF